MIFNADSMNHRESPCASQTAPAAQTAQQPDVSDVVCTLVIPGDGVGVWNRRVILHTFSRLILDDA